MPHPMPIDVIPAGVEDPTVGSHARVPLETLEGRNRVHVLTVGVHDVQRVNAHRPVGVAAAADERIGQVFGGHGRLSTLEATLDELPPARGEKHDAAVRQIAAVEIVVLAARQAPQPGAVEIHLVEMVEGVLRDRGLVELVFLLPEIGIVPAMGEQDLGPVVRNVGANDVARGQQVARQALQSRLIAGETFQHAQFAAGTRPPGKVFVAMAEQEIGCPFHEQQVLEIKKRIGSAPICERPIGLRGTDRARPLRKSRQTIPSAGGRFCRVSPHGARR